MFGSCDIMFTGHIIHIPEEEPFLTSSLNQAFVQESDPTWSAGVRERGRTRGEGQQAHSEAEILQHVSRSGQ